MRDVVVVREGGAVETAELDSGARHALAPAEFAAWAARQDPGTRWVWADTADLYPALLAAGVRLRRAVDLRLTRRLLRGAHAVAHTALAAGPETAWDRSVTGQDEGVPSMMDDLISSTTLSLDDVITEHRAQQHALAEAKDRGQLRLLVHAESIGALVAAEMRHAGVPFSVTVHDQQLTRILGPKPLPGGRPALMEALCGTIREQLGAPKLNPDSPAELLKALRAVGIEVDSTRQWELEQHDHPAIAPVLEYKKLARLLTANGWAWMNTWVHDGRFRPDWVPGGVVTGRWASRGGGALQLPRQIRSAVRADPGWTLVVADAAQLEPRVLAAMAGDRVMARAARGADLYQGLVDQRVVASRPQAKLAMLGALYGSTTGEAGALMPRLMRAFPDAVGVVESAARSGERGERVSTWLGRTSPYPSSGWFELQSDAQAEGAGRSTVQRAGQAAREWGRFTRNFVVQGTAAEWALCWLGHLRQSLATLAAPDGVRPELVYFLHDEVMVHAPQECADDVVAAVEQAAVSAGELLFGGTVEFPVQVAVCDSYDQAK
ncbi:bifunctional 3'-5' exonuclease/DNA polymerase [Propionibacteriaceae bacterium Y1685]|uniref:bifunctional 3'-5' exonuclease/DNA polymerase n=1 Tax=Microlunatus sp. Y1700 TaxID=3418487 RepID=UPI003B7F05FF